MHNYCFVFILFRFTITVLLLIYSTSGNRTAINLDYLQHIRSKIINPLLKNGSGGIEESLEAMNSYHLLREDLDNIVEVSHWPGQKDIMARIDSKVQTFSKFSKFSKKFLNIFVY